MRKEGRIFIWILIIIIVILIIYVIFANKQEPPKKENIISSPPGSSGAPVVIPPPATTISQQVFSINDKIYAGADLINTYKSCSPSTTNIDNTYSKGELIGTFLRRESTCIVIAVKTYPFGYSWIPFEGSKDVYLPINALVYKG